MSFTGLPVPRKKGHGSGARALPGSTHKPAPKQTLKVFTERLDELDIYGEVTAIAAHNGTNLAEVMSRSQVNHIANARHAIMYFVRERFGWSYPSLARLFGRDHSSVRSGCLKHERRLTAPYSNA